MTAAVNKAGTAWFQGFGGGDEVIATSSADSIEILLPPLDFSDLGLGEVCACLAGGCVYCCLGGCVLVCLTGAQLAPVMFLI